METALAIYEALIQANVPPPAARRVAESLERDMSSSLATKQDLQHLEQLMTARFETVENLESRVVMKLGALMTLLFGVAGAVVALLR
jgi:signal recognition particle GTPase